MSIHFITYSPTPTEPWLTETSGSKGVSRVIYTFNFCFRKGRFFHDWKKQRLAVLRKDNKPVEDASSYRPICLSDRMGKVLQELILQRIQSLLIGENCLSENQFGFREGRFNVDAIQAVV